MINAVAFFLLVTFQTNTARTWPPDDLTPAWKLTSWTVEGAELPRPQSSYVLLLQDFVVYTLGDLKDFDNAPFFVARRLHSWAAKDGVLVATEIHNESGRAFFSLSRTYDADEIRIILKIDHRTGTHKVKCSAIPANQREVRREWGKVFHAVNHGLSAEASAALKHWLRESEDGEQRTDREAH